MTTDYQSIRKKYGVIMLDLSKSTAAEIATNAAKNIALAKAHKEVALYFGKDVFSAADAAEISAAHGLHW